MNIRNILSLILILISLACLYPGIFEPILSIKIGTKMPLLGTIQLYDSKQSIIETIKNLHANNNSLVAFLILAFSVLVPIIKALLLIVVLLFKKLGIRKQLYKFVAIIGKWSMADVFVVGVFLAFLATQSNKHINAELHEGFYYFLAYCIISLIGIQLMDVKSIHKT